MEQHYQLAHVGMNCHDEKESLAVAKLFELAFGWKVQELSANNFASTYIETLDEPYLGKHGHLSILCDNIEEAMKEMESKGFHILEESKRYTDSGKLRLVYLAEDFGGFSLHLTQRQ